MNIDLHWRSERTRATEARLNIELAGEGWVDIQKDGSIQFNSEDDFYSGTFTLDQAQELLRQLIAHPRINKPFNTAPSKAKPSSRQKAGRRPKKGNG